MSFCQRSTASTNSSATYIISTPWRTRRTPNYPQELLNNVGPRNMVHSLGDQYG